MESHAEEDQDMDESKRRDSEIQSSSDRAMSYDTSGFLEFNQGLEGKPDDLANDVYADHKLVNFDDGVELGDVTKNYRDMLNSLSDFKE